MQVGVCVHRNGIKFLDCKKNRDIYNYIISFRAKPYIVISCIVLELFFCTAAINLIGVLEEKNLQHFEIT